ncbi:hypothetical protein N7519_002906 [Penicillium mononematosum]|uniref:uncharacterized protein n=1 Tax=Penicillium mononematosum TaxID=268346 RepID=UPI0025494BED|nr:uncharacterized protein N7519_002906 [Penicillium mononematosum]KAJ6187998.1 hypothetical protein N7519_002906 [Penicillium mononematosum]
MNPQPVDPEAVAPVVADASADAADVQLLAQMAYKQELRQSSIPQGFAIASSIMGLVPSVASALSFSLPAGPAGMVWVGVESPEHIHLVAWVGNGMDVGWGPLWKYRTDIT